MKELTEVSSVTVGLAALIVDVDLLQKLVFVSDDCVCSVKHDVVREYEISCLQRCRLADYKKHRIASR